MNLPRLSVTRPVTASMVLLIIVMLGFFSIRGIGLELLPDMNFPVAAVVTSYQGAGPEEVENLVTRPLEEVLATVNNVDKIQSQSQENSSLIIVQFYWGTDIDDVLLDLRDAIDRVRPSLPDDANSPRVLKFDPNMFPIISLALAGEKDPAELRRMADEVIVPRLERIPGVASATIVGGLEREISVKADPAQLLVHGLTLDSLAQALRANNLSFPGGKVDAGGQQLLVRTQAEFTSIDDIRNVEIATPTGQTVRLADVAIVEDGFKQQLTLTRVNGVTGVGIDIVKETGANTVQVSRLVQRELKSITESLPSAYRLSTVFDSADFINSSIRNLTQTAAVGGLLAVIILFVFLRHFASTLVVALSIPISIIATFTLIRYGGLTLNLISLGGLGLGLGMLVDNAIVVLENIFRYRQLGHDSHEAAVMGTNEVSGAITSSTLTTVAVFAPIVLAGGLISELFGQMSWTISYSLAASLFVSLTIVPLFASRLTKGNLIMIAPRSEDENSQEADKGKMKQIYRRMIEWSLRRRGWVLVIAFAFIVGTIVMSTRMKTEFLPSTDGGIIQMSVELESGKRLEASDRVMRQIEQVVMSLPEVDTAMTTVGGAGEAAFLGVSEGNRGQMIITLKPLAERSRSTAEVAEDLRNRFQNIPGADITISDDSMMGGGMTSSPIFLIIRGDDTEVLKQLAEEVADKIRAIPGTRNVETSLGQGIPELQVHVHRSKAFQMGLTSAQVAQYINNALNGQVATRYRVDGEEIDVRVRHIQGVEAQQEDLLNLLIPTGRGSLVPLRDIAEVREESGPVAIQRDAQQRAVSVQADLGAGYALGPVAAQVQQEMANMRLPAGYSLQYGGDQHDMTEAFGDLGFALILAVLLVYMILAAQFESFLHPFGIMLTFPLSVVGGLLGLIITGRTFNVTAFIGLIMLAGIIVNNGIVLVDYINKLRERGKERNAAIVEAGITRLRPILMTTLTTVLGLAPLALGIGDGAEVQAPLATVVLFGLTLGTLLTLIVVPVLYSYLDDLGGMFRPKKARARRPWWRFATRWRGATAREVAQGAEGS